MKHVAVLMGGWSAEREVSLRSGKACADALERTGHYKVSRIDVTRDIAATLRALAPDAALNVLHGRPGEDGTLQGMLEISRHSLFAFRRDGFRRRHAEGHRQTVSRPPTCRAAAWSSHAPRPRRVICCRRLM